MAKLVTSVEIPLQVPVPVAGADGKQAERSKLTLARPRTRHLKQLAVAIGPELVKALLAEGDVKNVDMAALAETVVTALFTQERLDALTAIVADMAGESVDTIDALDLLDLMEVGKAVLAFFPALQSFTPIASPQI